MPWKDTEKRNAFYRQRWADYTKEQRAEFYARWPSRQSASRRREHLKGRYGITPEQWEAMFEAQSRCCAICKAVDTGWKHDWHTDHDHKTGKVRGILCHTCNRTLGQVNEDPARLQAFIDYLTAGTPQPPG